MVGPRIYHIHQTRSYPAFLDSKTAFEAMNGWLRSSDFRVKRMSNTFSRGSKHGVHVNFVPKYKLFVEQTSAGSYYVKFDYYGKMKVGTLVVAGVLTGGLTTAVGVATYAVRLLEADEFVAGFWRFVDSLSKGSSVVVKYERWGRDNTGNYVLQPLPGVAATTGTTTHVIHQGVPVQPAYTVHQQVPVQYSQVQYQPQSAGFQQSGGFQQPVVSRTVTHQQGYQPQSSSQLVQPNYQTNPYGQNQQHQSQQYLPQQTAQHYISQQPNQQYQQSSHQYPQQPNQQYTTQQYTQQPIQQYTQQPTQQYTQQPTQQYTQQPTQQYTQTAQQYTQGHPSQQSTQFVRTSSPPPYSSASYPPPVYQEYKRDVPLDPNQIYGNSQQSVYQSQNPPPHPTIPQQAGGSSNVLLQTQPRPVESHLGYPSQSGVTTTSTVTTSTTNPTTTQTTGLYPQIR